MDEKKSRMARMEHAKYNKKYDPSISHLYW